MFDCPTWSNHVKATKILTQLIWLVVWLPFYIFPYIGNLIIPIDVHIFQRFFFSTTSQSSMSWSLGLPFLRDQIGGTMAAMASSPPEAAFRDLKLWKKDVAYPMPLEALPGHRVARSAIDLPRG